MSILSQGRWFEFDPWASRQEGTNLFVRQWWWGNHTRHTSMVQRICRDPYFPETHYIHSFLIVVTECLTKELCWFEWEMGPIGSGIWTLGPRLAELRLWGGALARRVSLGLVSESLKSYPTPGFLSASCLWLKMWHLSFLLLLHATISPIHKGLPSFWSHEPK